MPPWRIYYEDGSTYAGDPFLAPQTGVQVVVLEDLAANRGYRIVTSKDAFYFKDGVWWGCDEMGLWDYLMQHVGPKAVLFGRTMSRSDEYRKIVTRARVEGLG